MWGKTDSAPSPPGADWRVVSAWLLAVAGIFVFDSGSTALRTTSNEYPARSALIEYRGPIEVVFVDTPGRGGTYIVTLATAKGRIGSWPGCFVARAEIDKWNGKQALALYLGNSVYEVSVGGEFLCTHDPSRGFRLARMGRLLQSLGVGCFLAAAIMMFPSLVGYGRRRLK